MVLPENNRIRRLWRINSPVSSTSIFWLLVLKSTGWLKSAPSRVKPRTPKTDIFGRFIGSITEYGVTIKIVRKNPIRKILSLTPNLVPKCITKEYWANTCWWFSHSCESPKGVRKGSLVDFEKVLLNSSKPLNLKKIRYQWWKPESNCAGNSRGFVPWSGDDLTWISNIKYESM